MKKKEIATKDNKSKTPEEIMCKLQSDLKFWQRELRIEDIDIKLRWFKEDENIKGDDQFASLGEVKDADGLYALILIANTNEKTIPERKNDFGWDYELTLVHELLHVKDMEWMRDSGIDEILYGENMDVSMNNRQDNVIESIAEALVRARRGIVR